MSFGIVEYKDPEGIINLVRLHDKIFFRNKNMRVKIGEKVKPLI